MKRNLFTASEVAARLGVRLETVYAYVSRGVLARTLGPDGHTSRFEPAEVDELARRGRPRRGVPRVGTVDVSLATSVTRVEQDRLLYRGVPAAELATRASFEEVAELLWTGVLPDEVHGQVTWPPHLPARKLAHALLRVLPPASSPLDRFAALAAALGPLFPLRGHLQPATVLVHARHLLGGLVDVLPELLPRRPGSRDDEPLATRLHARLSPRAPRREQVRLLDVALILLADHELATSTMAARVAASTRADPFAVALAGFGALHGPLHGSAALGAHRLLLDAESTDPESALARALVASASPTALPGFGHPVYRASDPRAVTLLHELEKVATRKQLALLEQVRTAASAAVSVPPNVDFALAALAYVGAMPVGATEAIFALARTAGFIAHALEEYQEAPLRFRARALYLP